MSEFWTENVVLDWRAADDFHVYGCEWGAKGLKFYADGALVREAPASEIGRFWRLTEPIHLWFDQETFEWEGYPGESDLPVDYEIEYIRVWQHEGAGYDDPGWAADGPLTRWEDPAEAVLAERCLVCGQQARLNAGGIEPLICRRCWSEASLDYCAGVIQGYRREKQSAAERQ